MNKLDVTKDIPFSSDCGGKMDLDFDIISVDTRYWPSNEAEVTFRLLQNFSSDQSVCEDGVLRRLYVEVDGEVLLKSGYIKGDTKSQTQQNVRDYINANVIDVLKKAVRRLEELGGSGTIKDKTKTIWSTFRDYVNSKEVGVIITRQGIINELSSKGFTDYSKATIDCIRNMSEKVGFLEKTNRLGYYKIAHYFPIGYTNSQLRKDYDKHFPFGYKFLDREEK